jgi:hypothetical protein
MGLMHRKIISSPGAEACFGLGVCTRRDVSEGEGDPEYIDNGSERVESLGGHLSGSNSGCGCNSENRRPVVQQFMRVTPSKADMPRSLDNEKTVGR